MLDEVAWLFNLRGSDIDYNPVFFAYAVITQDQALVFTNPSQVDDTVRTHLGDSIQVKSYDEFFPYLRGLGAELGLSKEAVSINAFVSSLTLTYNLFSASTCWRQEQSCCGRGHRPGTYLFIHQRRGLTLSLP